MKKINIQGYEFCNFGDNNLTNEMELISSSDRPQEIFEKVKLQEPGFENIWFNPSAPCTKSEFFGLMGTEEQYAKVYKEQKEAAISKKMVEKFGWGNWPDKAITDAYEEELRSNYKDWWE